MSRAYWDWTTNPPTLRWPDPTDAQDAATKAYVLANVGSVSALHVSLHSPTTLPIHHDGSFTTLGSLANDGSSGSALALNGDGETIEFQAAGTYIIVVSIGILIADAAHCPAWLEVEYQGSGDVGSTLHPDLVYDASSTLDHSHATLLWNFGSPSSGAFAATPGLNHPNGTAMTADGTITNVFIDIVKVG